LEETTGTSVKGQKILDVGCGMGFFLEIAKAEQAIPFGIDISQEAAQFAMQRVGIDTVEVGEFETTDFPPGFFQLMTGWNVLEHTRAPDRWLARAHHLLADDGMLLVKVPNVRFSSVASKLGPVSRALGLPTMSYLATCPPLHLYGFSPTTLRQILSRAGFEVLTVEGAPIRETWGAKGRLIETVTRMMSAVSGGVLDFQVVIMALARKR
jgi:2-polyprenyl-3-methyl-5-hydroxy-6-metoxy-1,4-benzoquinol methylase